MDLADKMVLIEQAPEVKKSGLYPQARYWLPLRWILPQKAPFYALATENFAYKRSNEVFARDGRW